MKTNDIYEVLKEYIQNHNVDEIVDIIKKSRPDSLEFSLIDAGENLRTDINGDIHYNEKEPDIDIAEVKDYINSLTENEVEYAVLRCNGSDYLYYGPYDRAQPDSGRRKFLEDTIGETPENYHIIEKDINVFREHNLENIWESFEPFVMQNHQMTCEDIIQDYSKSILEKHLANDDIYKMVELSNDKIALINIVGLDDLQNDINEDFVMQNKERQILFYDKNYDEILNDHKKDIEAHIMLTGLFDKDGNYNFHLTESDLKFLGFEKELQDQKEKINLSRETNKGIKDRITDAKEAKNSDVIKDNPMQELKQPGVER